MQYLNAEGIFECTVNEPTGCWIGESGDKQTPFIRVPVEVIDDGPEKGKGIVWQGWLTDAAFENTIKTLKKAFDFNGDLSALINNRQTLAGRACSITTEMEHYNGKSRCKIKWLNAPNSSAKPMDQQKLDNLVNRLNKKAMLIAGSAPATKAEAPEAKAEADPLPF